MTKEQQIILSQLPIQNSISLFKIKNLKNIIIALCEKEACSNKKPELILKFLKFEKEKIEKLGLNNLKLLIVINNFDKKNLIKFFDFSSEKFKKLFQINNLFDLMKKLNETEGLYFRDFLILMKKFLKI